LLRRTRGTRRSFRWTPLTSVRRQGFVDVSELHDNSEESAESLRSYRDRIGELLQLKVRPLTRPPAFLVLTAQSHRRCCPSARRRTATVRSAFAPTGSPRGPPSSTVRSRLRSAPRPLAHAQAAGDGSWTGKTAKNTHVGEVVRAYVSKVQCAAGAVSISA
jgi:hypothetical protein